MPPGTAPNHLPVRDGHEERLQRVEGSLQDVAVSVAKIGLQQEHLVETLEKGFEGLQKSQEAFLVRLEALSDKVAAHEKRFEPLEAFDRAQKAEERLQEKRNTAIKAFFLSLLLVGGGVFVTKLAEMLWGKI